MAHLFVILLKNKNTYMKTILKTSLIVIATGLVLTSCRRERDADTDTSAASDNALAENCYGDIQNIADEAYAGNLNGYRADTLVFGCATVIRDTTSSPRTITIDFGTTNCPCTDGRNRRGKIITTYTGGYKDPGTVITHTTDDYFVNDNEVIGTKVVTNMGTNTDGNIYYTIDVNGTVIKANGGGTLTWTSDRVREYIQGASTPEWDDDVYLITGTGSGTRPNGQTFTVTILTALRKEIGCRHFVSGSFELLPSGKPARILDYGNGTCDNQATVTINGNTYTITLPN